MSYRKVARHFGVNFPGLCASTICGWEKEKESLQSSLELKGPDAFRQREHKHPEMRAALIEFLLNQELNKKVVITYHLIKQKAAQIYQHLNYDPSERMSISDPYICTLLKEIGMTYRVFSGEVKAVTKEERTAEKTRLRKLLKKLGKMGYKPEQIWNMDVTALLYGAISIKDFALAPSPSDKLRKERFSVAG